MTDLELAGWDVAFETHLYNEYERLAHHELQAGWAKWRIGGILYKKFGNASGGLGEYGDKIAEKAALVFHRKDSREVYEWVSVAKMFPTEQDVRKALGEVFTWQQALSKLPSIGKDPMRSGGKTKQLQRLAFLNEWNMDQMRTAIEDAQEDDKADLIGHFKKMVVEGFDLLAEVDAAPQIELDPIVENSTQFKNWVSGSELSVQNMTKGQIKAIQAHIRLFNCIRCQENFDTQFHHWPSTRGAGGEDWRGIPLCPVCHSWAQTHPEQFTHLPIVKWLQETLALCLYALSEVKR